MKLNHIYHGECLGTLKTFPDKCIDMVMTSPPYWALRDYGTASWEGGNENCDHLPPNVITTAIVGNTKRGIGRQPYKDICGKCGAKRVDKQLGLESTFDKYITKLCDIFDEVKRVLKDEGTIWVNLGDTYGGIIPKTEKDLGKNPIESEHNIEKGTVNCGVPDKCLVQIPFRFAIEMVNRGWILRNTIIWHKRNCMPSSIKDRFTVDFEYLYFFSKKKKYYFEQQREPHQSPIKPIKVTGCNQYSIQPRNKDFVEIRDLPSLKELKEYLQEWRKKTGLTIDEIEEKLNSQAPHHWFNGESYPTKEDWLRIKNLLNFDDLYDKRMIEISLKSSDKTTSPEGRNKRCVWTINPKPFSEAHFAVYPEELCVTPVKAGCPEKGVVLDPFFGSGTTGLVARKQGKNYVGIELNPDYIKIAEKRLKGWKCQVNLNSFHKKTSDGYRD